MTRRHRDAVASCAWLGESEVQDAGCLTVAVGHELPAVASAFGIDLDDAVASGSDRHRGAERFATAVVRSVDAGPATIVVEDNGFEGSREVVLKPASRAGKAASIFWNVNGMVIFTCARRGKVLWSGELGMGEDMEDLPRRLVPFAELVEDDDVDPVAAGAAMVAAFTGVDIDAAALEVDTWYPLTPQVEQPPVLTAESSALRWAHPDLVAAIDAVLSEDRRALARIMLHRTVAQASLADDPVVVPVLESVMTDGPGEVSTALESWERRSSTASEQLWRRQDEALNAGGVAPLREEANRAHRPLWVIKALRYACHVDDRSALLGVADAMVHVYMIDGLEAVAVDAITRLARAAPAERSAVLAGLPSAPTKHDRDRALDDERQAREQEERDAELAAESTFWGGLPPTARMRASAHAQDLAIRRRDVLGLLEPLSDAVLSDIADWAARQVLGNAGLLQHGWIAEAMEGGADLTALFERMFSDPEVVHTSFRNEHGDRVSSQAMALPAIAAYSCADPYDAACCALSVIDDGPPDEAARLYSEVRTRFGLG